MNGNDLMDHFGLPEGELIGEILKYLLKKVLGEPELNTKEQLLSLSAEFLHKRHIDI